MSAGITVKNTTGRTLGWVALDPSGRVRLHGFSEELGRLERISSTAWQAQDTTGATRTERTRRAALAWLWEQREARLQALGR